MTEPTIGKYRILVQLGEGHSSSLYLAEDTSIHRKVALKVAPHSADTTECSPAFQREAWRSSALNHPNVATIFDVGTDGTLDYLAAEWLEGGTLRQRLKRGALPSDDTLDIAIGVARALQASHEAWFVHRDIRPENIMLRTSHPVGGIDFDRAALIGGGEDVDPLASPRGRAGILQYLSPEQVRGDTIIDSRSDVYSLGIVIYEMLGGTLPFKTRATLDILAAIVEIAPAPLDTAVPVAIRKIVERTLQKSIHDRYQTAEELLDDLMTVRLDLEMRRREQERQQLN